MCHKSWLFSHRVNRWFVNIHSSLVYVFKILKQMQASMQQVARRLMHAYYYYDQVKASNALGHTTYTCDNLPTVGWLITLLELLNALME